MTEEEANNAPPIKVWRNGYLQGAWNGFLCGVTTTLLVLALIGVL